MHHEVHNHGSKAVEAFGIKLAGKEDRDHQIERDPNCQKDWTAGPFRSNLRADCVYSNVVFLCLALRNNPMENACREWGKLGCKQLWELFLSEMARLLLFLPLNNVPVRCRVTLKGKRDRALLAILLGCGLRRRVRPACALCPQARTNSPFTSTRQVSQD